MYSNSPSIALFAFLFPISDITFAYICQESVRVHESAGSTSLVEVAVVLKARKRCGKPLWKTNGFPRESVNRWLIFH